MSTYSFDQVSKHDRDDDCWVIINDEVYNVTKFLKAHPGGDNVILAMAGKDVTKQFNSFHDPKVLQKVGAKYKVGKVNEKAPSVQLQPKLDRAPVIDKENILVPSDAASWNSGGTAHILPKERAKATFDVEKMMEAIYGSRELVEKRRFILNPTPDLGYQKYDMSREELMKLAVDDFITIHKAFTLTGYRPSREEVCWMSESAVNTGPLMPCFGLFLPTIIGQASDEQAMSWLPKALTFEIVGSYAQTELAHGSNVRGLQTTAVYDKENQEFILDTPTLGAMKWWNSNAGCVATHAAVYAQLIIDGKEYGVHVFFVQLRDENHNTLPGIECGDVGRKMGDNSIDTGYIRFKNVRVPREHLFAKRQHVEPDGTYVKHKKKGANSDGEDRMHYLTMMQARSGMVGISSGKLAMAATIATRYSCVRHQGFADTKNTESYKSAEMQVIDYQVQRYRIFKQIATAYALRLSGKWMNNKAENMLAQSQTGSVEDLPEIHASSAGLKGLCTKITCDGIEDCRKCCGGHGYLLNSGIAQLFTDYVWQATAEGDWVVMLLQTARYLMKAYEAAQRGEELAGLTQCLEPLKDPKFDPTRDARPRFASTTREVMDLNYLLNLFKYRTLVTVKRCGDRMKMLMKNGKTFDEAWNASALALKTAAITHIYYFILRNFVDVVQQQQDEHVANALRKVCALFACCEVIDGQQWAGLIDGDQFDLIQAATVELLDELRPDAVALVDAFDFPDKILNSSLGRSDGNVYEALYTGARESHLNKIYPFEGFEETLKPHLNQEFLKLRGKCDPDIASEQTKSKL